jgi:hypothetical protein
MRERKKSISSPLVSTPLSTVGSGRSVFGNRDFMNTPLSTAGSGRSVFGNRDVIAWEIVNEQVRLKHSADATCENARLAYGVKAVFMSIVTPKGMHVIGSSGFDIEFLPRAPPGKFDFGHYLVERRLPIVVLDTTQDERCNESTIVQDLGHRFYVATPIVVHGEYVGALCILDDKPRESFLVQEALYLDQSAERFLPTLAAIKGWRNAECTKKSSKSSLPDESTDSVHDKPVSTS